MSLAHKNDLVCSELKAENIIFLTGDEPFPKIYLPCTAVSKSHLRDYSIEFDHLPAWVMIEGISKLKTKVGPEDDIWALGSLAFSMATGRCPYARSSES